MKKMTEHIKKMRYIRRARKEHKRLARQLLTDHMRSGSMVSLALFERHATMQQLQANR